MHPHQPADSHVASGAAVDDGVAFSQLAWVDANVGQLTEAAFLELESESHQWLFGGGLESNFFFPLRKIERFVSHFGWTREIAGHGVKQWLDRLVLVCRTEKHRR